MKRYLCLNGIEHSKEIQCQSQKANDVGYNWNDFNKTSHIRAGNE